MHLFIFNYPLQYTAFYENSLYKNHKAQKVLKTRIFSERLVFSHSDFPCKIILKKIKEEHEDHQDESIENAFYCEKKILCTL